ncbi:hypothetical protein DPEC_G00364520 [Dallia pectoralis]|nr:hypothetical protein DPEC_G00364520 [Dallia pectoralis]
MYIKRARTQTQSDDVNEQPPCKIQTATGRDHDLGSRGDARAVASISNPEMLRDGPSRASDERARDWRVATRQGFSSAMATDTVFHMFPDPREYHDREVHNDNDRFIQKQYPMLHMKLNAHEHPSIIDVRYASEDDSCPLCKLDRNTLDSLKVLKPHEVRGYLDSYNHRFTEEQVNVHLGHTVKDDNVIGVIQNMSVDLIGKSYSLANAASLCVMNRISTHMGRPLFVPDQDAAKVHNDAVKQFIGLASTCQMLMKYKHSDNGKGATTNPLL